MTSTELVTKEVFQQVLPKGLRTSVDDDLVNHINKLLTNHPYAEQFRDNLLGYSHVINNGRFKVTDYLNAVHYVSYKLMGDTNITAFTKTFPDRIKKWQTEGVEAKQIASYVSMYNGNKLVQNIYEQTITPTWVLNQDLYQKAINTQAELMLTARSEKVRSDAANSLMNHLKKPEKLEAHLKIDVDHKNSAIDELEQTTRALVEQQKAMLLAGMVQIKDVAESRIINVTAEEVTDND